MRKNPPTGRDLAVTEAHAAWKQLASGSACNALVDLESMRTVWALIAVVSAVGDIVDRLRTPTTIDVDGSALAQTDVAANRDLVARKYPRVAEADPVTGGGLVNFEQSTPSYSASSRLDAVRWADGDLPEGRAGRQRQPPPRVTPGAK